MQKDGRIRFAGPDRVRIDRAAPTLAERIALVRDFLAGCSRSLSTGPSWSNAARTSRRRHRRSLRTPSPASIMRVTLAPCSRSADGRCPACRFHRRYTGWNSNPPILANSRGQTPAGIGQPDVEGGPGLEHELGIGVARPPSHSSSDAERKCDVGGMKKRHTGCVPACDGSTPRARTGTSNTMNASPVPVRFQPAMRPDSSASISGCESGQEVLVRVRVVVLVGGRGPCRGIGVLSNIGTIGYALSRRDAQQRAKPGGGNPCSFGLDLHVVLLFWVGTTTRLRAQTMRAARRPGLWNIRQGRR